MDESFHQTSSMFTNFCGGDYRRMGSSLNYFAKLSRVKLATSLSFGAAGLHLILIKFFSEHLNFIICNYDKKSIFHENNLFSYDA